MTAHVLPSLQSQTVSRLQEMERIRQEGHEVEPLEQRSTHCEIDLSDLESALRDVELRGYDEYLHMYEPTDEEVDMWQREAEIVEELQKLSEEITQEDLDELDDFEIRHNLPRWNF